MGKINHNDYHNLGYIRVADFGLSKFLSSGQLTTTFCGTPEYLAP